MKERVIEKQLAIKLRKEGKTYSEICSLIPNLSKGTLAYWIKDIKLSKDQINLLVSKTKNKLEKARLAAAITNHNKRLQRDNLLYLQAQNEFAFFAKEPIFTLGLALYWAEGTKKNNTAEITNSDPELIIASIKWFERFLKIPRSRMRFRLYTHEPFAKLGLEDFWAKKLGIDLDKFQKTIYKLTRYNFKKNDEYKGCLRVRVGGVKVLRKILYWQKMIVQKI